jgi:hypothetical protein
MKLLQSAVMARIFTAGIVTAMQENRDQIFIINKSRIGSGKWLSEVEGKEGF